MCLLHDELPLANSQNLPDERTKDAAHEILFPHSVSGLQNSGGMLFIVAGIWMTQLKYCQVAVFFLLSLRSYGFLNCWGMREDR